MLKVRIIAFLLIIKLILPLQGQDSLDLKLEQLSDLDKIEVLHNTIPKLWLNYPPKALDYGLQAFDISKRLEDSTNISKSLRLIAGVYYYWGEYDTSLDYNKQALKIAISMGDTALINNAYNNIGLLYYNLGDYHSAMEHLMTSLQLKKITNEVYGKAATLNNIGQVYEKNEQFEKARDFYLQALEIARNTDNQDQDIYSNNNIGRTYLLEGHPETAKHYFEKGLEIAKRNNNVNWGSISIRGLAEIALARSNNQLAEKLALESLASTKEIDDKKGLAETFYLLAKVYQSKGRYNKALTALDSSDTYARKIESRQQLLDNLKLYVAIHRDRKDLQNLINYQETYIKVRDSLFQEITKRNLELIPIKLKEASDQVQLAGQQAEIEQRKLINKVYVVILLISIPVIALLILLLMKIRTSNLQLRSSNQAMLDQKIEIERQKEEIQDQNNKLTQSIRQLQRTQSMLSESEKMAAIGQLVGGLAHELNNPLNFIGGIIKPMKMNLEDLKSFSKDLEKSESYEEMQMLLKGVEEGTQRASSVIEKLKAISPKIRTQEKEDFDLSDCIDECIFQIENETENHHIISNLMQQSLVISSNYYELSKILYHILINALQAVADNHPNNRKVYVEVLDLGEKVQIVIQDNGTGIPKDLKNKIFDPFYTTKSEIGASGLGLFIARTLVERNKGSIKVESDQREGSTFIVSLPKS